jgi:hypothetical protein
MLIIPKYTCFITTEFTQMLNKKLLVLVMRGISKPDRVK